jgi:hypothetical protein
VSAQVPSFLVAPHSWVAAAPCVTAQIPSFFVGDLFSDHLQSSASWVVGFSAQVPSFLVAPSSWVAAAPCVTTPIPSFSDHLQGSAS